VTVSVMSVRFGRAQRFGEYICWYIGWGGVGMSLKYIAIVRDFYSR